MLETGDLDLRQIMNFAYVAISIVISVIYTKLLLYLLVGVSGYGHGWGWPIEWVFGPAPLYFGGLYPSVFYILSTLLPKRKAIATFSKGLSVSYLSYLLARALMSVDQWSTIREYWLKQKPWFVSLVATICIGQAFVLFMPRGSGPFPSPKKAGD